MFLVNPIRAKAVPMDQETLAAGAETTLEAPAAPQDTTTALPFDQIEIKPEFNGGDATGFSKWVYENLQYPKAAYEAGLQGRVVIQFTVEKDGKVSDVKVLRGVHPDLDAEAVRVVSSSPDWKPGYVKGEPVRVRYLFPLIFKLEEKKKDEAQGASIQIRGQADSVLVLLDGIEQASWRNIDPTTVESMQVLKGEAAVAKYGEKGRHGAVEIISKKK